MPFRSHILHHSLSSTPYILFFFFSLSYPAYSLLYIPYSICVFSLFSSVCIPVYLLFFSVQKEKIPYQYRINTPKYRSIFDPVNTRNLTARDHFCPPSTAALPVPIGNSRMGQTVFVPGREPWPHL